MSDTEPTAKRIKAEADLSSNGNKENPIKTCKHFVIRKKRFCRITLAKDEDYCGEHLPVTKEPTDLPENASEKYKNHIRIPCPLDSKHTVYAINLQKHLKICNAIVKDQPKYIVSGLNAGPKEPCEESAHFRLADIDETIIESVIEKINRIYDEHKIDEQIEKLHLEHSLLESEVNNKKYGAETLKHLIQTSSILGYLDHYHLFDDNTSYIEYGAGRGQVSFWLAQAITQYADSNVLLIDRASLRHKMDNRLDETYAVKRIRADISDFDINQHDLIQKSKQIVGVSKHLCGAATDFAIRCILNGNAGSNDKDAVSPKTSAFIIAVCCHHRCDWQPFVGKEFFIENGISIKEFLIITKMVGWAICGSGMSRERRKAIAEKRQTDGIADDETPAFDGDNIDCNKDLRETRRKIGQKCKRLIDYARIKFLEENGYQCSLKSYVSADVTLENVCMVAFAKNS